MLSSTWLACGVVSYLLLNMFCWMQCVLQCKVCLLQCVLQCELYSLQCVLQCEFCSTHVWHVVFVAACVAVWVVFDMAQWYAAYMWDMTHSYVWHDSFICETWLIHMCDIFDMARWYAAWRIHTCHGLSHEWHDSFICVTRNTTHCVWHDAFISVPWPIRLCGMTHSYVWHGTFARYTTNSYMWHDSFI